MKSLQSCKFMDGTTFHVGERVEFFGDVDWIQGTIFKIEEKRYVRLFIQPDNEESLPRFMRWELNPVAAERSGKTHYVEPRDSGLAGGAIRHIGIGR